LVKKKPAKFDQKVQHDRLKGVVKAAFSCGKADSERKHAKDAHNKNTLSRRNSRKTTIMIRGFCETLASMLNNIPDVGDKKNAFRALSSRIKEQKDAQRTSLWRKAIRDASEKAPKTSGGKAKIEALCKGVRHDLGSPKSGSRSRVQRATGEVCKPVSSPQSACSTPNPKPEEPCTPVHKSSVKFMGRPKIYCAPGLYGGDSKYAVVNFVPREIMAPKTLSNEEIEELFAKTTEGRFPGGDKDPDEWQQDEPMTTEAPVESSVNDAEISEEDTMEVCEDNIESVGGNDMTDAASSVRMPQSQVPKNTKAPDRVPSPRSETASNRADDVPDKAYRFYRNPKWTAVCASPVRKKGPRRSRVPGLTDEDVDRAFALISLSGADQKMINDLCDSIARLRIFDEAASKELNTGTHTSAYENHEPDEDHQSRSSSKQKRSGESEMGPNTKIQCATSPMGHGHDELDRATETQSSLKRKSTGRCHSEPGPKRLCIAESSESGDGSFKQKPRTAIHLAFIARNQDDDDLDEDTAATGIKLESPDEDLEEPTMSTASLTAARNSGNEAAPSPINSYQDNGKVDIASKAYVQAGQSESFGPEQLESASSTVSPSEGAVFSARDGSKIEVDGRALVLPVRSKTPSQAPSAIRDSVPVPRVQAGGIVVPSKPTESSTSSTPKLDTPPAGSMGPPALPASAYRCNSMNSTAASGSSSLTTSAKSTIFSQANNITLGRPLPQAGHAGRDASAVLQLEIAVHVVPHEWKVEADRAIKWAPTRGFMHPRSNKVLSSFPELVNFGPGATVAPLKVVRRYCSSAQRTQILGAFRKVRKTTPQIWSALITSRLQSGRTPEDVLDKDCNDILGGTWVVDLMRLDRLSRSESVVQSEKFFTPKELPKSLHRLWNRAHRMSTVHFEVFEKAVKQWAQDPKSKGNKATFLSCLRKAGWTEAHSRYAEFIRWTLDSAPRPLQDAFRPYFRWTFPRLYGAVSNERLDELGLS
jgi:hypothetical protein